MDHENLIKTVCAKQFNVKEADVSLVKRLMGGMSNYTYVVDIAGQYHTFRIPGKNAERFVDRYEEAYHINRIRDLNLNNNTVYLDTTTGIKIAEYIEGVPLHEKDPHQYLESASKLLKRVHNSGITSPHHYAPFKRLDTYEGYLMAYEHTHGERYYGLKERLLSYRDFLDSFERVLTHGDAQISNFIVSEDALKLTDWEFSGMNDPFYDIACFGNVNFDHALALLPVYLEGDIDQVSWNRLHLWRAFQCLQWHNVAWYKHYIGLSKDLSIDFEKVALMYLDKATNMLEQVK